MVFGLFGSTVIAPIDCTGCLSKTGLYVVPPSIDFQTPPLAAPMKMVRRAPSCTASMAAMRPDIAADPMLRAPRPEMVSESTLTGLFDCGTTGADSPALGGCAGSAAAFIVAVSEASGAAGDSVDFAPGMMKREFGIATFASI